MDISVFDLFSIGIGPSSSHTVGPMKAAHTFANELKHSIDLTTVDRITIELFGSLALTGKGHGTDKAILLGLENQTPDTIDPEYFITRNKTILEQQEILLFEKTRVKFNPEKDLIFNTQELLPYHTNGMRFTATDKNNKIILQNIYYSIGGGFIVNDKMLEEKQNHKKPTPYPFNTAKELFEHCDKHSMTVAELMMENEKTWTTEANIKSQLLHIANIMHQAINKGCHTRGILTGGLNLQRRAPELFKKLTLAKNGSAAFCNNINWIDTWAIAVGEENAAFGRVVTAPTNGAAGIIPAVLEYYKTFCRHVSDNKIVEFLLTAGAIGMLYKKEASISGAEVGCQGEVGVAASMAAGAFAAVLNGTLSQVENAAEISMEHHLGLTCDPIKGLVQIPCIERNAIGAVQAVNAATLALLGTGKHKVSLDNVIITMKKTGQDMMAKYKETSQGGLAVNVTEC